MQPIPLRSRRREFALNIAALLLLPLTLPFAVALVRSDRKAGAR